MYTILKSFCLRVLAAHLTQRGFPKLESTLWSLFLVFLLYVTNVFSSLVKPAAIVITVLFIMSGVAKLVFRNQRKF
jgi:hypothetical protein